MRQIGNLVRLVAPRQVSDESTQQRAYRVPDLNLEAGKIADTWEKRIIQLGDGRSVGEIAEIMYRQEPRREPRLSMWGCGSTSFARRLRRPLCNSLAGGT